MEFREHELANGLQVVAECNAAAYSSALGFFVNTGARDEHDAVAHDVGSHLFDVFRSDEAAAFDESMGAGGVDEADGGSR